MRKISYTIFIMLLLSLLISAQTTWTKINPNTADYFNGVHAFSSTKAIAVGAMGSIWATTDGGTTWEPRISPISEDLKDVFFVNATT